MKQYNNDKIEYLNVGKIINTQGIKGELKVNSTTDFVDERFAIGNQLVVFLANGNQETVTIKSHRKHKKFHIISFQGYDDINEVEKFKNGILKIDKDNLQELEENEYYYFEIIGLEVYETNGKFLGTIKEILSPGANDVWVVDSKKYNEVLIPYIESVVLDIDLDNNKVIVDLPEGLI